MKEPYTDLIVDKRCNISNNWATDKIYAPGNWGSDQMLPSEITKTNKIAEHIYMFSKSFDISKFLNLL